MVQSSHAVDQTMQWVKKYKWATLVYNDYYFFYSLFKIPLQLTVPKKQIQTMMANPNHYLQFLLPDCNIMPTLHSKQIFPFVAPQVALAPARRYENPSSGNNFPLRPSGATFRWRSQLSGSKFKHQNEKGILF